MFATNSHYSVPHASFPGDDWSTQPSTSSSATEKTTPKSDSEDTCLVCAAATNGLHFQVSSCRACAAFFKRSVKDRRAYKCKRGDRSCNLVKKLTRNRICKFCRLQKCYLIGMRFEPQKDGLEGENASDSDKSSPKMDENSTGSSSVVGGNKYDRDITKVIDEIKTILSSSTKCTEYFQPSEVRSTPFQQLQLAFSKFCKEMCPSTMLHPAATYDKLSVYSFQEHYAKKYAQLLMSCDPFVHLCFEDKYKLFKHSWSLVHQLERQYSSCKMYGYDLEDTRLILTDTLAVDLGFSTAYYSGLDPSKLEKLVQFCLPMHAQTYELLTLPVKKMRLTQFELTYVLCLMIFGPTNTRGLTRETKDLAEQLVEQFSTELHNYYVCEMDMPNYASRHAKMFQLISSMQTLAHSVRDHMTTAKIFDIFVTNVYDSELYV